MMRAYSARMKARMPGPKRTSADTLDLRTVDEERICCLFFDRMGLMEPPAPAIPFQAVFSIYTHPETILVKH